MNKASNEPGDPADGNYSKSKIFEYLSYSPNRQKDFKDKLNKEFIIAKNVLDQRWLIDKFVCNLMKIVENKGRFHIATRRHTS